MEIESSDYPRIEEVLAAINSHLGRGTIVILCGTCEVEYDGRAAGYLGIGERIVICKPDGTLLIHRPRNHDPVNWQPPGSVISAAGEDDRVIVTARRSDPDEHVRVILHEIANVVQFRADDTAPLELSGTEADMHEYVLENPDEIEDNLRILEHERETPYGSIDIFANDATGTPVVIEVKRRRASLTHVDQLKRYVSLYDDSNPDVRGILVAPAASDRVIRTLHDNGLEFVQIDAFAAASQSFTSTSLTDFE